jgi:hypothetical protein
MTEILRGKQIDANACDDCYTYIQRLRTNPECYLFHRDDGGPACHYVGSGPDEGKTMDLWYVTEQERFMLHRIDGPCETITHTKESPARVEGRKYQFWGIPVPKEWTEGKLTVEAILATENQEERRVGVRAYDIVNGEGAFAKATHKKTVDLRAPDENSSKALEALVELNDGSRWLVATDGSSGRSPYYMRVPITTQTCAEAQRHLYGAVESVERT